MKLGTCCVEHMPVNAPGSPKSTTRRPAKTSPPGTAAIPSRALLQERRLRQPVADVAMAIALPLIRLRERTRDI